MVNKGLKDEGHTTDLFFYNPNIHPSMEYKSRLDALRKLTGDEQTNLIISGVYDMVDFLRRVALDPSTRCGECYHMRLAKTAEYARRHGYEGFSTTLTVSPYQDHELLRKIGDSIAAEIGIPFVYKDFRCDFREGQRMARELGVYMQKYCGCIYSEEDRYRARIQQKPVNG